MAVDNAPAVTLSYLRISFPEQMKDSVVYKLRSSQVVLGRNKEQCDIHLPHNNLSKQHCQILIDGSDHFIMDLNSRNKTYRKEHCLRPNAYYELTHGINLTLADLQCQYFIGDVGASDVSTEPEERLSSCVLNNGSKMAAETPTMGEGISLATKEAHPTKDDSGTMEYRSDNSNASTRTPSPQLDDGAAVSLSLPHRQPLPVFTEDPSESKDDTMECSPQLLAGNLTTSILEEEQPKEDEEEDSKEPPYTTEGDGGTEEGVAALKNMVPGKSDDTTMPYDDEVVTTAIEESLDGDNDSLNKKDKKKVTVIDPTVAYELETDNEDGEETAGEEEQVHEPIQPTVAYQLEEEEESDGGRIIEPTVAYQLDSVSVDEEQETTDKKRTDKAMAIEPTVPYVMDTEDNKSTNDETMEDTTTQQSAVQQEEIQKEATTNAGSVQENGHKTTEEEMVKPRGRKKGTNKKPAAATSGRGRGRRGKISKDVKTEAETAGSNETVLQAESKEEVEKEIKQNEGNGSNKDEEKQLQLPEEDISTQSTKGTKRTKRGGAKRRLPDDDSLDVFTSKKGPKKRKMQDLEKGGNGEEEVETKEPVKPNVDLSDESPDIPTLRQDTPTNNEEIAPKKSEKEVPVDDSESIVDQVPAAGSSVQTNNKDESPQPPPPPPTKGRRGRKRKSTATSTTVEKNEDQPNTMTATAGVERTTEEDTTESEAPPVGRTRRVPRKPAGKLKATLDPVDEDEKKDGKEDDEEEKQQTTKEVKQTSDNKRVKIEVQKVSKRRSVAPKKGNVSEHSNSTGVSTETPITIDTDIPPKVMFTGVLDETGADTVRKLGGEMVDSVFKCTHLVTDKVRRTVKFLCCLSRGCTIVSTSWLDKCLEVGSFVPAEPFLIKDKTNERMHKFVLKESIAKARSLPMLKGWSVFVTDRVKPCPKEMGEIIESAGGKVLDQCPSTASDNQFVVSCENDMSAVSDAVANGVTVCSSEVLLTGSLRQQLQIDVHKIVKASGGKKRRR